MALDLKADVLCQYATDVATWEMDRIECHMKRHPGDYPIFTEGLQRADDLENKLGAILGNPEMMAKISQLAQSMGQSTSKQDAPSAQPETTPFPEIDLSMLQKLSGLAGQSGIDKNQRSLLSALRPYVSQVRISKLERAMRAAKMASMAGIFQNKNPSGR